MSASPIAYPGLGLDIRHYDQDTNGEIYPMGIHSSCIGSESELLLVREVAMMIVMNELTDKPDWHVKVFDETIAEKWIEEALALPTEPLYHDIVPSEVRGKVLKVILDRKCLEFVSFYPEGIRKGIHKGLKPLRLCSLGHLFLYPKA